MRGAAMVLMLVTLLGGCVSGTPTQRWTFERANTPEAQVKRDANECLAQSLNAGEMNRPGLVRVDRAAYRACMEQRGYAVRTTTE
jgi:hypothetical protein